ncbi:hypothetical protein KFK09_003164 [Dendrobium nobile]|uniref:Uncharacterized protein n=1 Tax=Dendrobium nobile TaxID=94219 RepID=A0A8T3C8B6_DENNO|nr:hypothetical protein KFK09_003164 [Dendrobium nobile]
MSRISRGYLPAGRNAPAGAVPVSSSLLRRGKGLAGVPSGEGEEILDLFSRTRRGYAISSSVESDVLNRTEKKVSVGLAKSGRSAAEEFLSAEIGKHDYDWLLTPPGTPLFSSVDSTDHQPPASSQRSRSNVRSVSLVKPSRLSVPQSENSSPGPRIARSSSTTRASFSTSSRTPSSVLNTSTASVNSRPTTPGNKPRTPATTGMRPAMSRSTTPARTRPNAINPAAEKPKPIAQISRPSTPPTRSQFPASSMSTFSSNSTQSRTGSRPSTPTRRLPPPAPNSRPSSPARSRTPVQPIIPPDFPLDAPPNLRTKIPERPVSAGRQRPAMELTVRGNSNVEVVGSGVSSSRRASSPVVARGRFADNPAKGRVNGHRDGLKLTENQKPVAPEKKPVKPAPGGETGSGYGRTMSKNSLNMAIKHMDIRQGMSGMRGASLFPHSIRSTATATATATTTSKDRPVSKAEPPTSTHKNRITDYNSYSNELMPKNYKEGSSESEELKPTVLEYVPAKTIDMKFYGSSRYDSILLKEDARSLNWLQSLDEKPDESHLFDRRFDPLPEPFILL